ncbi:MAG: large-conductance mechanosensitive channel protein MscL [Bacilli bacterium]|nr:large-conductance mechanosensitive channel protein MscL [Bacilli bacterium]
MKKFFNEFKEFISKGNVIDLAVGVVIGTAFSKIVSSLVDNIIMPLVGLIIGGVDFSGLSIKFQGASIKYGLFIQNIVDFLIVAFCIFTVIKIMNSFDKKVKEKIKKEEEKKEEKKPELTKDQELLIEIRDLLKKQDKETKKK